ncbi:urea-proton symporter DUR3 isoform X2 [Eurytemora carolleeae]|uniref:urea-proton symporter DUR3 isoform X2 n=1 Tax=Eurytemora carolleeae TaxID=1294199 RepID=UPI000C7868A5|nr:urea-proton symporter DUR3 isoform X2 [Eurytemora carolleeae]|eukprot:XP_023324732.1 urea-proton symporter DUR3-like isoform X2 [Eurytemora affinis]
MNLFLQILLLLRCVAAIGPAETVLGVTAANLVQEVTSSKYFTELIIKSRTEEPEECSQRVKLSRERARINGVEQGVQPTVTLGAALLIFALVGIFAAGIAQAFQMVRKHVFHDADNLDTAFDAGGKVSIGLTATTIVSQWTWSATLLQSSTVASKYGISGPYWYAGGATIQIIIFSILSIMLKTRAPGAKTFLQVIKARFGKRTHLVFCTFAFFTNLIVMMSLTIAGTAVLNSLVDGLSPEAAAMLLAAVIGGYTLIGGLGATFYVSYFNTMLIFILIIMLVTEVFYNPFGNPENPFGSAEAVYDFISCWKSEEGEAGNQDGSYLTFYSSGGLIFGIVNIVGNFGTVFCDQAYWQSSVAAKPLQGVWGFIFGGLTWFAIPFTLATTMGLAYLGLSSAQGFPMLSDEDVTKGLAAPLVAQKLLGATGEYAMLFLILMAVMSTGSAEVIAVSSIIIYDVYQTYLCPFRPTLKDGQCILCQKFLRGKATGSDLCDCPSCYSCYACKEDIDRRRKCKSIVKPHYTCPVHAEYKEYQEQLLNYKNWCIIFTTFLSIPLCLFCWGVNLNLAWSFYFTGILISSSVVPIALSILWARATATGLISGVVGGCLCGLGCWLYYASTFPGGLSAATFVENTGREIPMLLGNLVSISGGAVFSIVVTFCTRWHMTKEDEEAEWEKTRDIDNPLHPWIQVYKGELCRV